MNKQIWAINNWHYLLLSTYASYPPTHQPSIFSLILSHIYHCKTCHAFNSDWVTQVKAEDQPKSLIYIVPHWQCICEDITIHKEFHIRWAVCVTHHTQILPYLNIQMCQRVVRMAALSSRESTATSMLQYQQIPDWFKKKKPKQTNGNQKSLTWKNFTHLCKMEI